MSLFWGPPLFPKAGRDPERTALKQGRLLPAGNPPPFCRKGLFGSRGPPPASPLPLERPRSPGKLTGKGGGGKGENSLLWRGAAIQEFYSTLILVRGSLDSYQTGIHRKAAARPERGQLPAPQGHEEAGEERAGHQVEEGRLALPHPGQGRKGRQEANAVTCRGGRRGRRRKRQGPLSPSRAPAGKPGMGTGSPDPPRRRKNRGEPPPTFSAASLWEAPGGQRQLSGPGRRRPKAAPRLPSLQGRPGEETGKAFRAGPGLEGQPLGLHAEGEAAEAANVPMVQATKYTLDDWT